MNDAPGMGVVATLLESSDDPQAKQASAPGGMRGEKTGEADGGGYPRTVGGIAVVDASGVAHVEALEETPVHTRRRATGADRTPANVLGAAASVLLASILLLIARRSRQAVPAAFPDDAGREANLSPSFGREPAAAG
jgi:hypothetical protein